MLGLGLATAAAFAISRPAGAADGLRFLVVGDWGNGNSDQRAVAAAMAKRASSLKIDLVLSTGDNFYPNGVASTTDPLWQTAFRDVYADAALQCPWYVVLGNHDHKGDPNAQIEFTSIDPRWHLPAPYYRHRVTQGDGAAVEFFMLDTTPFADDGEATGPAARQQLDWLAEGLAASGAAWRFVVGHHPVFSGGKHGPTPALATHLAPLLQSSGVQAYLNGHDHDLQHIERDGVHYLTSGGGSQVRPTGEVAGTRFAASAHGFMEASIAGDRLAIAFVGADGAVLYETDIGRTRSSD